MNEVKVSVVIPVLNVAPYLRECLESMVRQTLKEIEVICVDGGSTDGSLDIIKEFTAKDGRITLLHEEKKSSGYADNLGIDHARGEYIGILESDDYVTQNMYEILYDTASSYHADMVRADYQNFWGDGEERCFLTRKIAGGSEEYGRLIEPKKETKVFKNDMQTWAGIYKREFLIEQKIRHNESQGAAYQDTSFWFLTFALAKTLVYVEKPLYRYRQDNPSSSINDRKKIYAMCQEYKFLADELKKRKIYDDCRGIYVYRKFFSYVFTYYRIADELKKEFACAFHKEMHEHEERGELAWEEFSEGEKKLLEEILYSPDRFHNRVMEEKKKLREIIALRSDIVQFGCGGDGTRLLKYLDETGEISRLTCFCDNNRELHGKKVMRKEIMSPETVRERYPKACYLISSIHHSEDMRRQLMRLGVNEGDIFVVNIC